MFQATLDLLDQRALPRSHRSHQVEDLAALLSLEGGGTEVTNDLGDGALDPKEFLLEEVVDLNRVFLVEAFHLRILALENLVRTWFGDHLVKTCMRELGRSKALPDEFQVVQEATLPALAGRVLPVLLNQFLDVFFSGCHGLSPIRFRTHQGARFFEPIWFMATDQLEQVSSQCAAVRRKHGNWNAGLRWEFWSRFERRELAKKPGLIS